jgi:hypothetical protein
MAIIAKKTKSDFTPCPEGLWPAVAGDIVDLGMVATQWGEKHKVQIRWFAAAEPRRNDGKPYMVSKKYTLSLHEKASLRQMLEVWRGKKFTEDELDGFDLETLIGVQCQIQVAHGQGDEGPYAFPQVILKAPKNARPVDVPNDYVREQDRPGYKSPTEPENRYDSPYAEGVDDDSVPF